MMSDMETVHNRDTEPQDIAQAGPTPYDYLFAETAQKDPQFLAKVKKEVRRKKRRK